MVIAGCAALFSVTGIATLFAGAFVSVAIMAGALELGKLVSASYLYRYWSLTPKSLKAYLMTGVTVLMFITSLGIYAYLSAAYAKVAAEPARVMNEIAFVEARQTSLNDNITRYRTDIQSIDDRRGRVEGRLDNSLQDSVGGVSQRTVWTSSRNQIRELDALRTETQQNLERAIAEKDSLELVKVQKRSALNQDSKVGTFIYVAESMGVDLDDVVKYFILVIVLVFDPLAVSLILAYNVIVMSEKGRPTVKQYPVYGEGEEPKKPEPEAHESEPDPNGWASARMSILKAIDKARGTSTGEVDPFVQTGLPYYMNPKYDWDTDTRWLTDEGARFYKSNIRKVPVDNP